MPDTELEAIADRMKDYADANGLEVFQVLDDLTDLILKPVSDDEDIALLD